MRNLVLLIAVFILLGTELPVWAVSAIDAPHGAGSGFTCANCHTSQLTLGTTGFNNICLNCHHPWNPKSGNKPFMPTDAADPFSSYTANRTWKMFQTSHRWSGSDNVPAAGAQPPLDPRLNKSDIVGGLLCVRCHDQHSQTYKPFLRMPNDKDQLCLDCHRSRNVQSHLGGSHPVNVAYSSASHNLFPTPQNANPANPTSAVQLKNGRVYCTTCHQVHYADSNSATFHNHSGYSKLTPSQGFLLRTDLRGATADRVNICTNCHSGKLNHSNKGQNVQCPDCHAGHVEYDPQDPTGSLGKNSFLIRRYMNVTTAAGAVRNKRVFHQTSSASTRNYKDPNGTGVCQGCHAVPTGSRYPVVHTLQTATAKDCNLCHYHNNTKGAFTAAGSCSACHGYPPLVATLAGPNGMATPATNATNPASPGAHGAHVITRSISCEACHNGYTTKGMPSNTIDMGFSINSNTFTGFAGSATGGTFTGSDSLATGYSWSATSTGTTVNAAPGGATCANVYCHGATLTGGANTTPSWTGSNQAVCGACHGTSPAAPPTAGSHLRHVGAGQGPELSCVKCHGSVTDNSHIRGSVHWDLSAVSPSATYTPGRGMAANSGSTGAIAPSTSYGTCSNVYCHSNVQGAGGVGSATKYATPTWGSGPLTCSSCHQDMAHDPAAPGSHVRHAQFAGFSCDTCHNGAGSGTVNHANGTIDIIFSSRNPNGVYSQGPNTPGNGYGSCSNTVCHGASKPVWGGGPLAADCTGCHGNDTSATVSMSTGKHTAHVNNDAMFGRGNSFGCVQCHASTVANDRTIANGKNHANGVKNYSGARSGRIAVSGSGSCSSNYCHSQGRAQNQFWNMTAANWYSGRTLSCTGCHGTAAAPDGTPADFASVAGEPNYANGGPGSGNANSHNRHVSGAGITDSTGCAKCHYRTVNAAVPGKLRDYSTLHVDGSRDISFSARASIAGVQGRYSSGSQQCLNTYCHGAKPSVQWGSSSLACNACHSAEVNGFNGNNAGAHKLHYQVGTTPAPGSYASMMPGPGSAATSGSYQFNCTSCHFAPAQHASGEAVPGTAAAQIYFGYTGLGRKGSYSYGSTRGADNGFKWTDGSCSTTYCHSNGNGGDPNNTTFTWASPQGTLGCTGCHGNTAASGTPISSNKHGKHINNASFLGAGNNFSCVDCHAKTVDSDTHIANKLNHVNRFKDFSGVRGGGSATYANSSCSATYCHSSGKRGTPGVSEPSAPVWTSSTILSCDGCHGPGTGIGYPNYATGGAGTDGANSHPKHVTALAISDTRGCAKCHGKTVDAGVAAKLRDYSTLHLNRSIDVAIAPSIGGSYNGAASGKSCSNVYCHSSGQSLTGPFTPMSTPRWGGTLSCKGCHGYDASAGNKMMNSNRHANHIDNAAVVGRNIKCQECHNATTADSASIANYGNHDNQSVNVKFENAGGINIDTDAPSYNGNPTTGATGFAKVPGSAVGSCSNVYCHSDGTSQSAPLFKSPAWNGSFTGSKCVNCHGDGSSRAHNTPDVNNAPGAANANNHVRHVEYKGLSCDRCHAATVADNAVYPALPASVIPGGLHLNRSKSVSFKSFVNMTGEYNGSTKTCSNLYCHSNGNGGAPNRAPQWGSKFDCRACHGGDAASATPIASGKHTNHVNNASFLGAGNNFACANCHAKTVGFASNTTIINQANHVNGMKDYSGASHGRIATAGTGACNNNYCHSTGQKPAAITYWNMTGANWYSGRSLTCTGCHGNSPAPEFGPLLGAPNYVNGGVGTPTANSHKQHVAGNGLTDTTGCAKCHFRTVNSAVAGKLRDYSTLHIDGSRDISFSSSASMAGVQGRYSSNSQQCMNTYCHGANPSVQWGSTGLACNACHSAEVNGFTANNAGGHKFHYQVATTPAAGTYATMTPGQGSAVSATSYQFNCTTCHSAPAQHASGQAVPGTAAAQIYFGYSGVGRRGSYSYGTTQGTDNGFRWSNGSCATTYCHSNGRGGDPRNTNFTWASPQGTLGCNGCHGDAASSDTLSGKHGRHVNNASFLGTNFVCSDCHAKTVSGSSTIINKMNHVNGFKDFSGARAYRTGFNAASCTSYCHSTGKAGVVPAASEPVRPDWNSTTTLDCRGCHGNGTSIAGEPDYQSAGAGLPGANSHGKHVKSAADCVKCHVRTTTSGTAIAAGSATHLNRQIDVSLSKISPFTSYSGVFDSTTMSCSATYCHGGNNSSPSWGGSTTCNTCHNGDGPLGLSGRHDKHATMIFTNITCNSAHQPTAYAFGCKNCHPTTSHAQGPADANRAAEIATSGVSRITGYTEGAPSTDGRGFPYTTGSCTTTCHTRDGVNPPVLSSFNWSTSISGSNCGICHNKQGDANPVWSAPHTKHINVYSLVNTNFSCNTCHAGTASDCSTINGASGRNQHPNGVKNVQFNGFAGGAWDGSQCSNTYCHSNGTSIAAPTHTPISWLNPPANTCSWCHDGPSVGGPGYPSGSPKANSHRKHTAYFSCQTCHSRTVDGNNNLMDRSLHVNKVYDLYPGTDVSLSVSFTVAPGTGNSYAPAQCSNISCHGGNSATWGSTLHCQECHGAAADVDNFSGSFWNNGTMGKIQIAGQWDTTGHGRPSGNYDSGNPAAAFTGPSGCEFCHDPNAQHRNGSNAFRLRNYSSADWGRNAPCMVCHAENSAGVTVAGVQRNRTQSGVIGSRHFGAKHGGGNGNGGQFCWDCHDPHGDTNIFMIHSNVAKTSDPVTGAPTQSVPTVFNAAETGTDFAKTQAPFVGICNVCHSATNHYRSTSGDGHNAGTVCVECHSHNYKDYNEGFRPLGTCNACHGYPPVRRGLAAGTVFRQNNYSGARYEDYSGGGGAHTIEKHVSRTVSPNQGWVNCKMCHSAGVMDPAFHTMDMPMMPSKVMLTPDPRYKYDFRRSMGPERYSGQLTDNDDNMTGRCSNIKCHFKPSKKWSTEK